MVKDTFENETLMIDKIVRPPLAGHVLLLNNHLHRYNKAIEGLGISKKDIVIDASCGLGYGTFILSQKAKLVIGLDINPDYIKSAQKNFKKDNLQFFLYQNLKKEPIEADKVVCIETYEHIKAKKIKPFLRMILGYLKNEGGLFLTTQLGENKPSRYNKYHLNEPSINILYNTFARHFKEMIFEISHFKNSFGYYSEYCYLTLKNYQKKS